MDESYNDDCDVVVIGGGLSGLAAARTLVQHDSSLRVTLLEANNRLGGRVLSVKIQEDEKGKVFDLGAHWVGRSQTHVMSLMEEFNIKTRPQFLNGTKVMQAGGSQIRTYNSVLPNVGSWLALLELGWTLTKLERLAAAINILEPYNSHGGSELDAMTVSTWLNTNTRYAAVKDVIIAAFRCTFGVEPAQMSMLYFLTVARSAGGVEVLFESTEGGGQEFTVETGTGDIVDSIAKDIEKDVNIIVDEAVNTVEQTDDGTVCTLTSSGRIFRSRRLIVCIPPTQQAKIMWAPVLPSTKRFAMQSQQMGLLVKFLAVYSKPYWQEQGYSGELVSGGGDSDSPICITLDDSDEEEFALVGFVGGRLAVQWADKTHKQLEDAILDHLAECFGSWAYDNKSLTVKNWATEPFIEGSPVCLPSVGTMHAFTALRAPVGNIHFGGTESATAWIGYMEGAVQSGTRAALEVLERIKPQSLSSTELMSLQSLSTIPSNTPVTRSFSVLGIVVPVLCAVGLGLALHLRDQWAHCFIPFR